MFKVFKSRCFNVGLPWWSVTLSMSEPKTIKIHPTYSETQLITSYDKSTHVKQYNTLHFDILLTLIFGEPGFWSDQFCKARWRRAPFMSASKRSAFLEPIRATKISLHGLQQNRYQAPEHKKPYNGPETVFYMTSQIREQCLKQQRMQFK